MDQDDALAIASRASWAELIQARPHLAGHSGQTIAAACLVWPPERVAPLLLPGVAVTRAMLFGASRNWAHGGAMLAMLFAHPGAAAEAVRRDADVQLLHACESAGAVRELVRIGADVNERDPMGNVPLVAVLGRWRAVDMVQELLCAGGVDVCARDARGWSVLDHALRRGQAECVRLIADASGDALDPSHALSNYRYAAQVWPLLVDCYGVHVTRDLLERAAEFARGDTSFSSVVAALAQYSDRKHSRPVLGDAVRLQAMRCTLRWSPCAHWVLPASFRERVWWLLLVLRRMRALGRDMRLRVIAALFVVEKQLLPVEEGEEESEESESGE